MAISSTGISTQVAPINIVHCRCSMLIGFYEICCYAAGDCTPRALPRALRSGRHGPLGLAMTEVIVSRHLPIQQCGNRRLSAGASPRPTAFYQNGTINLNLSTTQYSTEKTLRQRKSLNRGFFVFLLKLA